MSEEKKLKIWKKPSLEEYSNNIIQTAGGAFNEGTENGTNPAAQYSP